MSGALLAASTPVYDWFELPFVVEMIVVPFGAVSGAMHGIRKGLDLTGVFTVALLCSVGGGAIRDVLLQRGVPVFLASPTYLEIAAFASVVAVLFARFVRQAEPVLAVVDLLLIGAWVCIGAEKALYYDFPLSGAAFLGVITAIGGGLVRDLMVHEPPAALRPGSWYAAAAIVASIVLVQMVNAGVPLAVAEATTIAVAAGLRAASLRFRWTTPTAYDVWGDLEDRLLAQYERARDARMRTRTE